MPVRSLLLIDDDAVDRKAVRKALDSAGLTCEIAEAASANEGLALARSKAVDCILIDYRLPDMDGLELLGALRAGPEVMVPIVMLTGEGNETVAVEAMKRGAQDYLPKSQLQPANLLRVLRNAVDQFARQRDQAERQQRLMEQALYDCLTGLGNRNLFQMELERAIARSARHQRTMCLLLIDLDGFKGANDTYGHEAGDVVLAAVGRRLVGAGRREDLFFRLGGDEFTGILEVASAADAQALARRVADTVTAPISFAGHELRVGASIGIALFPDHGADAAALLRAADAAMYRAKRAHTIVAVGEPG